VASRVAACLDFGLTGDAIDLDVEDGRLVAWKPAFGGGIVAAITATSSTQMATVRPGVLALTAERSSATATLAQFRGKATSRVVHSKRIQEDDAGRLAMANSVVGVGAGVALEDYPLIDPLLKVLDAELAATRKVTDKRWLPHSRQVGITGRSIGPALYVAVGISGKFNHMVGVRAAGLVLAINSDPAAPVFKVADLGIVGDWREAVPLLAGALAV
jgi:electron transfer flavoprotein alpha subunit